MSKVINFSKARDISAEIKKAVNEDPVETFEDHILGNIAQLTGGDWNKVIELLLRSAVRLAEISYPGDTKPQHVKNGDHLVSASNDKFTCTLIYEPLEDLKND